jgi:hypothetical protein
LQALNGEPVWEYKVVQLDDTAREDKFRKHRKCLMAYEDLNDENRAAGAANTGASAARNMSNSTSVKKARNLQQMPHGDDRVSVKVSQGLLYFNSEKFEKGDVVNVVAKKNSQCHSGEIASISHSEVNCNLKQFWINRLDGSKKRFYVSYLRKGKLSIQLAAAIKVY